MVLTFRQLYPADGKLVDPGHTCFNNKGRSSARLDYFLASKAPFYTSQNVQMEIGAYDKSLSDHVRLQCKVSLPLTQNRVTRTKPMASIVRPNIVMAPKKKKEICKKAINEELQKIYEKMKANIDKQENKLKYADNISQIVARTIVSIGLQICPPGRKTPKPGRDDYREGIESKIRTIRRLRDIQRTLQGNLYPSQIEQQQGLFELDIVIDKICHMGLASFPIPANRETTATWANQLALQEIECLQKCLDLDKKFRGWKKKKQERDMFMNPGTRGLVRHELQDGQPSHARLCY